MLDPILAKQPCLENLGPSTKCVSLDSVIYVVDGWMKGQMVPQQYVFYFDTKSPDQGWKQGPPMEPSLYFPPVTVINGKIYALGDILAIRFIDGSFFMTTCFQCLDPWENNWKVIPKGKDIDGYDFEVDVTNIRDKVLLYSHALEGPGA